MKTMSFTAKEPFVAVGNGNATQEASWDFIVENKDIIIKQITPIATIVPFSAESTAMYIGDIVVLAQPLIRTVDTGRLFNSPVRNTGGVDSPYLAYLSLGRINEVDLRLFAGQQVSLAIPFCLTWKLDPVLETEFEFYKGFLLSYEEVERKSFR